MIVAWFNTFCYTMIELLSSYHTLYQEQNPNATFEKIVNDSSCGLIERKTGYHKVAL